MQIFMGLFLGIAVVGFACSLSKRGYCAASLALLLVVLMVVLTVVKGEEPTSVGLPTEGLIEPTWTVPTVAECKGPWDLWVTDEFGVEQFVGAVEKHETAEAWVMWQLRVAEEECRELEVLARPAEGGVTMMGNNWVEDGCGCGAG